MIDIFKYPRSQYPFRSRINLAADRVLQARLLASGAEDDFAQQGWLQGKK